MERGGEGVWGEGRKEGVREGGKEGWFYSQRSFSPTPLLARHLLHALPHLAQLSPSASPFPTPFSNGLLPTQSPLL